MRVYESGSLLHERDAVVAQPVAGDLLERFVSKTVPILYDSKTANRVLEIPECAVAMERREQLVTCCFVGHGVSELLHDGPLVDLVLPWQFEVVLGLESLLDLGHHLLLPARKQVPILRVLGSPSFLCRDSYHLASQSIEIGGDLIPRHTHLIDDFAQLDRNGHDMHSTGPLDLVITQGGSANRSPSGTETWSSLYPFGRRLGFDCRVRPGPGFHGEANPQAMGQVHDHVQQGVADRCDQERQKQ